MALTLVTVHHEGAGAPAPAGSVSRCAHGGYTYGFGVGVWERFRSPYDGWATLNFNGESVDLVLTGNRMEHPVTDDDLANIAEACADARARGELVAAPTVRDHSDSPGSSTACSGDFTRARWAEVVAACTASGAPAPLPPPSTEGGDVPGNKEFVAAFANEKGAWRLQYDGGVQTIRGAFYGSYFTLDPKHRNDPARRFLAITAAVDGGPGYSIHGTKGETYTFSKAQ